MEVDLSDFEQGHEIARDIFMVGVVGTLFG